MTSARLDERTPDEVPPPQRATLCNWLGLAILVIPLFMLSTDVTVLYLAMPTIAADLLPVGSQMLWILHISEFLSAATMITFGLLARRLGARRLLLGAVAAYGAASLLAAYATNAEMLIAARALLGISMAGFTPAGMILIRRTFRDPKQYSVAFAAYMSAFTGGMAAGPPLGGLILEHFWWGAVFLINVPIAAVLLIGGPVLLERNHADPATRIDPPSVALSIAAILALVFGLQEISTSGFSALPAASTAAGAGLALAFIRRQRHAEAPLLDLSLFRIRTVQLLLVLLFVAMLGMTAADMMFPQYLQIIRELSPLQAGMVMLAPAIAGTAGTMMTPLLAHSRHMALAAAGTVAVTAATAGAMAWLLPTGNLVAIVTTLTVLTFLGSPFITLASQILISAVPEEKTGPATAIQDVTASLGMASSLAFVGGGILAFYRQTLDDRVADSAPDGAVDAAGDSFGAAATVATGLGGDAGRALLEASESVFLLANQLGWGIFAAVFAVLAIVVLALRKYVTFN